MTGPMDETYMCPYTMFKVNSKNVYRNQPLVTNEKWLALWMKSKYIQ